jgi:hypothetical protein
VNIEDVSDQIAARLKTITGLRVHQDDPGSIDPPCVAIALPEDVQFDQTYGRGSDRIAWSFALMVARVDQDKARLTRRLAPYLAGAGPQSIKQVIESDDGNLYDRYTAFHTVRLVRAEIAILQYGSIDYQGVIFEADIFGQGTA